MILVSRSSPSHDLFSFPKFVIFILAWVYHNGRRKTIAYLKILHILQWHMQNVQYPLQNMQYKTKLSPSYPQSYPQKGVTPMQNMQCPMQNTQYSLQNTQYSMKNMQYPMQNMQYPLQNMQYHMQNTQYPLQNMQYQTKLSPSYPQSYPQWICRRKMDLKSKSKCFILTWVIKYFFETAKKKKEGGKYGDAERCGEGFRTDSRNCFQSFE